MTNLDSKDVLIILDYWEDLPIGFVVVATYIKYCKFKT
jgi:hypothetical protein